MIFIVGVLFVDATFFLFANNKIREIIKKIYKWEWGLILMEKSKLKKIIMDENELYIQYKSMKCDPLLTFLSC